MCCGVHGGACPVLLLVFALFGDCPLSHCLSFREGAMRSVGLMMGSGANAGRYEPLRGGLARWCLSEPPSALFLVVCSR